MKFWIDFWTFFFFLSLSLFGVLAVVIAIGGVFNIHALLKSLIARQREQKKQENI